MSNLPTQIRDWMHAASPPWLSSPTGNGFRYIDALGLCSDLLLDKANQAAKIGIPGVGDPSNIPYLAQDRLLVQGPSESNLSFIARLQTAFAAWKKAGSRPSILLQLQAYMQNLQPGASANVPQMTIVGGGGTYTTWDQLYIGDALGASPRHKVVSPANFNWDGQSIPWRSWLVLYMSLVTVGLHGTGASITSAAAGSLPGGQIINGSTIGFPQYPAVWGPATSGTPVNYPWITLTGLSGLTSANAGQWITTTGFSHSGNIGTFPITQVLSSTSCVIANPNGVSTDTGGTWFIYKYPWIGPAMPWGAANAPAFSASATTSWGLSCSTQVIESIRLILQRWKSAAAYYPNIIIAFDGATGTNGSAYSPQSAEGAGNPDGTFGSPGKNVNGVWVPSRLISSTFDAYCQGTGSYVDCSVENVT
jgi:hypothetical protein